MRDRPEPKTADEAAEMLAEIVHLRLERAEGVADPIPWERLGEWDRLVCRAIVEAVITEPDLVRVASSRR